MKQHTQKSSVSGLSHATFHLHCNCQGCSGHANGSFYHKGPCRLPQDPIPDSWETLVSPCPHRPRSLSHLHVIRLRVASSAKFHSLVSTSFFPMLGSPFLSGYPGTNSGQCNHLDLLEYLDPAASDGSFQIRWPPAILGKTCTWAPGFTLQTSTVQSQGRSPTVS